MFDSLPRPLQIYLDGVKDTCVKILGPKLTGLYLQGSIAHDSYKSDKSDIDILAITSSPLSPEEKEQLSHALDHKQLPVPATGLEIEFITEQTAKTPDTPPVFELAISTGATWPKTVEENEPYWDLFINMAVAHEKAVSLYGPDAKKVLLPPQKKNVLQAMIRSLEWHRSKILDEFHDPMGQYSVLNACRSWHYAVAETLVSKPDGGYWVLDNDPRNDLVKQALAIRDERSHEPLNYADIDRFLVKVIDICQEKAAT